MKRRKSARDQTGRLLSALGAPDYSVPRAACLVAAAVVADVLAHDHYRGVTLQLLVHVPGAHQWSENQQGHGRLSTHEAHLVCCLAQRLPHQHRLTGFVARRRGLCHNADAASACVQRGVNKARISSDSALFPFSDRRAGRQSARNVQRG